MSNQVNCVACDEIPGTISIHGSVLVSKMFLDITGLKAYQNYTICKACQHELRSCYNFRKRCHEIFNLYNPGATQTTSKSSKNRQSDSPPPQIFANPLGAAEITIVKNEMDRNTPAVTFHDEYHNEADDAMDSGDEYENTFQYEDINPQMSDDDDSNDSNEQEFGDDSSRFLCDECSKTFSKRSRLVAHKAEHRNERLYSCPRPGCNSAFNVPHRLTRHLRNVHDADEEEINQTRESSKLLRQSKAASKPPKNESNSNQQQRSKVECEICNKSFTNKRYLNEHQQLQHLNTAKYVCKHSNCSKRFTIWSLFEIHMKKHKGQTDFSCKFCGKGFVQRKTFNSHLRQSHQMTQEEVDRLRWTDSGCDINGNKCLECDVEFESAGELFRHCAARHDEKTKFICDICGKSFTSKAWLASHQKYHRGVKNKKCSKCPSAFTEYKGLRTHLRRVHNLSDEDVYKLGFGSV